MSESKAINIHLILAIVFLPSISHAQAKFVPANPSTIKFDPKDASVFAHGKLPGNIKQVSNSSREMGRKLEAKLDHILLPDYLKAKRLQNEGKIKDLDSVLLNLHLGKVGSPPYAFTKYAWWMNTTLMIDLMNKGDMKEIWIAEGKPKTKADFMLKPLGEAAAAAVGITYPGEYEDLRKRLGWKYPDKSWARPFDRGDCAWSDEVLSLVNLNHLMAHIGDNFNQAESEFALKRLYYKLVPGNDNLFVSLLWTDGYSDPTKALLAFHRHFPNGVTKKFAKDEYISELLNSLSMARARQQEEEKNGKVYKYTGPVN